MQCKAKSKRSGQQCRRRAMLGQKVCMMHGGKSRKGLSHPNFKDGTHGNPRYLGILREHKPEQAERYNELAKDATRHSLEPEITTLDLRAEEIYRQIITGEYRSCTELLKLARAVVEAQLEKNRDKAIAAWDQLMTALRQGHEQERAWEKFEQLAWQRKPKLIEAEAKRKVLQQEMYQRNVVIQLLQALAASVKRNVTNADEADAIFKDIIRLSGGTDGAGFIPSRTSQTGH